MWTVKRVLLAAVLFLMMMARARGSSPALDFVHALSPQLQQFLRDNVTASNYLTSILDVQTRVRWLEIHYANDLSGPDACHDSPAPDHSIIRLTNGQQPIDEYTGVVFELLNSSHEEKFRALDDQARAKKVSQREFVRETIRIEYESYLKLKSDLPRLKFSEKDIAASAHYKNELNTPEKFEDFFLMVKNGLEDWSVTRDYGKMYDWLIGRDSEKAYQIATEGASLVRQSKWDEAIKKLKLAVELNPDDALAFVDLGRAYYEKGETNAALKALNHSISLDNEFGKAFALRARIYRASGKYDEAILNHLEAIRLCPKTVLIKEGLAWTYLKKGDRAKAFAYYQKIIDEDGTNGDGYIARGEAYDEIGDFANALKDYAAGSRINPRNMNALDNLAWLQACCPSAELRDGTTALTNARKVCEFLGWTNGTSLSVLAAAYAEKGDFVEAVKWQQKAISLGDAISQTNSHGATLLQAFQAKKAWREDHDTGR